jgi:hypothetical protein
LSTARDLLGEWRQVAPLGSDVVSIRFEEPARLIWTIEGEARLSLELTWAVRGDTLIAQREREPAVEFSFRLDSQSELVLESGGELYRYERRS